MNIAFAIPLADAWGMHGNVGWGWMVGMMVVMVLFWGAIILGIAWLIRGGFDTPRGGGTEASADIPERRETSTELLERRFAEGTITVEDYRERRKVLANGAAEANAHKDEALTAPRA